MCAARSSALWQGSATVSAREPQPLPALDDPRLAPFAQVVGRGRDGLAVVEGAIPVQRACASSCRVRAVLCTPSHAPGLREHVPEDAQWWCASKQTLSALLGFSFHRGVLAAVEVPAPGSVPLETLQGVASPLIAVAAGFTDPANVGALVRAARAFGVHHVLVDGRAADPYARKAIRASAGHVFSTPLTVCADLLAQTCALRDALGAQLFALTPSGDRSLRDCAAEGPRIVAFGSEGPGLGEDWMNAADARVRIPLASDVDSLNVASAAAVTFYGLS